MKKKKPLVLIADDEKTIRDMVRDVLNTLDLDYVEATNGKETLRAIASKKPELVLLDYAMPLISGENVLSEVRKKMPNSRNTPIIMLTGLKERYKIEKLIKLGIQGYIMKPLEMDSFIAKITEVIRMKK